MKPHLPAVPRSARLTILATAVKAVAVMTVCVLCGMPAAAAPLAASATLLASGASPAAATPRVVLGGYVAAALLGFGASLLGMLGPEELVAYGAAAAVVGSLGLMLRHGAVHPPATAAACLVAMNAHPGVAAMTVTAGAATLVAADRALHGALAVRRLARAC